VLTIPTTPETTSGPSSASTTTTNSGAPDAAALRDYLAFWDMYIELGGTPPPFDLAKIRPRLDELTTGAETAQLLDFLQTNAGTGLVLRGDIDHSPAIASIQGDTAVVRDCLLDRTGIYRVADGSRVDTETTDRKTYVATLRSDESGRWRVETISTEEGSCEP